MSVGQSILDFACHKGTSEMVCIPIDDNRGEKIQASHVEAPVFCGAASDFTLPTDAMRKIPEMNIILPRPAHCSRLNTMTNLFHQSGKLSASPEISIVPSEIPTIRSRSEIRIGGLQRSLARSP